MTIRLTARFLIVALLIALSGCTGTYYPKKGDKPEGYSEQRLADGSYEVSYETYKNLEWETIADLALYRAAELGKDKGYSYLVIEDSARNERVELVRIPAVIRENNLVRTGPIEDSLVFTGPDFIVPDHMREFSVRVVGLTASYSHAAKEGALRISDVMETIERDHPDML